MKAFVKAVAIGTLVGAAVPLTITIWIPLTSNPAVGGGIGGLGETDYLAFLPILVFAPIVFAACILIGLPLAYALIRSGWERGSIYIAVGAFAGAVLPVAFLWIIDTAAGYWIAVLGIASGTAAAWNWWSDRNCNRPAASHPSP